MLDDLNFVQEQEVSECDIENFSRLWQTFQVTYINSTHVILVATYIKDFVAQSFLVKLCFGKHVGLIC
jgi:hypothetical protein